MPTSEANYIIEEVDRFIEDNGDTVYIYPATATFDSRGDKTVTYGTATTTKGVIKGLNKVSSSNEEGVLLTINPRMLIKSDVTVAIRYKLTHRSINYEILEVRSLVNFEDVSSIPKVVTLKRIYT